MPPAVRIRGHSVSRPANDTVFSAKERKLKVDVLVFGFAVREARLPLRK